VSRLLLQQEFSCFKLQVFYQNVAYVFTHMLQVYVPNISYVLDVCCIKCFVLFEELGARRSDGGTTQAPGNGTQRASGRRM
jgi:hypothetical protein